MDEKIRVMFVDDEPNILRMVRRVLRNEPWEMEFYNRAEDAWQAMQKNPPDILVTDHRMEGMTGTQLLARVKAAFPDVLRIIFSGYTEVSTLTEAINQGNIYKFIHKPIKEEDLRLTIRRAAENVLLQRENRQLTERIQAQNEELRKLNEELEERIQQRTRDLYLRQKALEIAQTILENLPTAVLGLSLDGAVVYCNSACAEFLGVKQGELLGQNYDEALPPDFIRLIKETLEDGQQLVWHGKINDRSIFAQTSLFQKEEDAGGLVLSFICFGQTEPTVIDCNN
ncbi:MAG: response regulator [Calditrichaeota bacterium]|nr:MAG: response regulator [Calditrichota bacterium]